MAAVALHTLLGPTAVQASFRALAAFRVVHVLALVAAALAAGQGLEGVSASGAVSFRLTDLTVGDGTAAQASVGLEKEASLAHTSEAVIQDEVAVGIALVAHVQRFAGVAACHAEEAGAVLLEEAPDALAFPLPVLLPVGLAGIARQILGLADLAADGAVHT